jgi:hypothetical protein
MREEILKQRMNDSITCQCCYMYDVKMICSVHPGFPSGCGVVAAMLLVR